MTTRALVTGGTGFVGASVVRTLLRRGYEVHIASRGTRPVTRLEEVLDDVRLHRCDLTDGEGVDALFVDNPPEVVVHLAGGAHHARRGDSQARAFALATVGALNLLRACADHGVRHLVVGGSSMVHDFANIVLPIKEDAAVQPKTFRGLSKACEELVFRHQFQVPPVPVTVLRLFHIYGPWEPAGRLVPTLLCAAFRDDDIRVTEIDYARDFVFVEDVAACVAQALDHPPPTEIRVVNVGSGVSTPVSRVVQTVRDVTGAALTIDPQPFPATHFVARDWAAETTRLRQELGCGPRNLEAGIAETWQWFHEHRAYWLGEGRPGSVYP